MNNKAIKEQKTLKHPKLIIFILSFIGIVFAVLTHLSLINPNLMYHYFGNYTTLVLYILPFLSLVLIILSSIFFFKYKKISFIAPIVFALAGTFLAFTLAEDSYLSKIESDFLKHEKVFNKIIEDPQYQKEGQYKLNDESIFSVAPEQKLIVEEVINNSYAYCIVTIDLEDRFEGYVYTKNGIPLEWNSFDINPPTPLDIEQNWMYFICYKE